MRNVMALLATAGLAVAGLAATAAPATAQVTPEVLLSEILIDTVEPTQVPLGQIRAVEVFVPNNADLDTTNDINLVGYGIQVCTSGGAQIAQYVFPSQAPQSLYVIANEPGWTGQAAFAAMDRASGVFLTDASGAYADGVLFEDATGTADPDAAVCMNNAANGAAVDRALAPTDKLSAQRLCSIGPWVLAPPTLGRSNC